MSIIGISGKIGSGKDTIGKIIQTLTTEFAKNDVGDDYIKSSQFWEIKKFADKLKDIVCLLINCTREQLEDQKFKDTPLEEEWNVHEIISNHTSYLNIEHRRVFHTMKEAYAWIDTLVHLDKPRIYFGTKEIRLTPRLLLQLIGTECGRNIIHPNIWVNALFADYKGEYTSSGKSLDLAKELQQNWIITDVRFPNELQAVKDRGGITIRVNRITFRETQNEDYIGKLSVINQLEFDQVSGMKEHPSETSLDNAEFDYIIYNTGTIEQLTENVRDILITKSII